MACKVPPVYLFNSKGKILIKKITFNISSLAGLWVFGLSWWTGVHAFHFVSKLLKSHYYEPKKISNTIMSQSFFKNHYNPLITMEPYCVSNGTCLLGKGFKIHEAED